MNKSKSEALKVLMSIIKPENINTNVTNAINSYKSGCVPPMSDFLESSPDFYAFCEKFKELLKSDDVKKGLIYPAKESFQTPHNHISIEIQIPSYTNDTFLMHVFEKVILVYFKRQNGCKKFLAALNTSALEISSRKTNYQYSVVVWEKTRLPIREYDSYSPIKDSKIISSQWTKTNIDGTRSFAGGLKPENNPLVFTLEYGVLSFRFNNTTYDIEFSRSEQTFETAAAYNSLAIAEYADLNIDEKTTIYNSALNIVKASYNKHLKKLIIALIITSAIVLGIPLCALLFVAIEWLMLFLALSFS